MFYFFSFAWILCLYQIFNSLSEYSYGEEFKNKDKIIKIFTFHIDIKYKKHTLPGLVDPSDPEISKIHFGNVKKAKLHWGNYEICSEETYILVK